MTPGYVGADLMALCREAAMCTVNRVLVKLNGKKCEVTKNEEVAPEQDMQRRTEENVKEDAEEPDLPTKVYISYVAYCIYLFHAWVYKRGDFPRRKLYILTADILKMKIKMYN